VLAALLDLILPSRCAGCGEPGSVACRACSAALLRDPAPRSPRPAPDGLPECWSATIYDGAPRRMILACKERGRTALVPILGRCLAEVALAALDGRTGPVALVPIPSARAASRGRGHDPVRAAAAVAAAELTRQGRAVTLAPVLCQARRVADQAGLSSTQRAANLSGAFRVLSGPNVLSWPPHGHRGAAASGRPVRSSLGAPVVVLVDDIVTTGTTLAEGARALRAAGADVPLAITVAATSRRSATRRIRRINGHHRA
jgi:predicted amidophosphoribosyltransferase